MSAIVSPAPPVSTGEADALPPVPAGEIDASCRAPVMLLFLCAAIWLVAGGFVFGIIATLKFHKPILLDGCPWLTYGRVHPAALNALVYGFAIQAGLGVALWLVAQLGRTRLAFGPGIIVGTLLWNLGVKVGIIGILAGESTGYEWLEFPRYASAPMFCAYLFIGLGAMLTFQQRRERQFYISQWFLLAALFWFPWIYSTANFLLVAKPVRGVLQAAIDGWYVNNLTMIWAGFIGLAASFYFVPKLTKRPLHSHYLGIMSFWMLAIFGSWGGIAPGTPLPAWMPALSTVAALLTIVPILAIAINFRHTLREQCPAIKESAPLKFIVFGAMAFIVASLAGAVTSLDSVSAITHFTWFEPARMQLLLYGFFAMTMFGAIHHIAPRLMGTEFCPRRVTLSLWLAVSGVLLYVVPLGIGGIVQGFALNNKDTLFAEVMQGTKMFVRISTTGDLLMALANLLLLVNLAVALVRALRPVCQAAWISGTKTAEVTP